MVHANGLSLAVEVDGKLQVIEQTPRTPDLTK